MSAYLIALLSLGEIGNTLLTPFYWLISSVMVAFHWLLSPLFGGGPGVPGMLGQHSGATWLLAILLMTCVIRGIMLPLYARQLNSQRSMTALQPKIKAIQAKYKDDRQRAGSETMKLYQDNGVSPYASCLPMLAQMPVFISVFWVIRPAALAKWDAIAESWKPTVNAQWDKATGDWMDLGEAAGAALPQPNGMFAGNPDIVNSFQNSTIFGSSLSQTFLPMDASSMGTKIMAIVLIVVMMATLFYQQWYMMKRNMPPSMLEGPMGQQQKIMLYVFPFIYVFSGLAVPIGVMFYWLVSNVWTMLQQYFMVRIYPTPDTPAYAAWEDRMIAQGKDPVAIERERIEKAKAKAKAKGGGMVAKMAAAAEQQQQPDTKPPAPGTSEKKPITRTDPTSGKKIVVRQQPHKKSRAKRKR